MNIEKNLDWYELEKAINEELYTFQNDIINEKELEEKKYIQDLQKKINEDEDKQELNRYPYLAKLISKNLR
jgi:CDP-diacylglycerol pyrophosphatase